MRRFLALALALLSLLPAVASARVVRVVVERRTVIANGARFGNAGPYERLTGRIYFALDPRSPRNARIVDLALAPRNEQGEVEAWSEFVLLRPVDPRRGTIAMIDVVNRGGTTFGVFHLNGRGGSPDSAAAYGDALLLRRGTVILSLGWQWDVAPGGNRLHFGAPPVRTENGEPITGLVRADFTADAPGAYIPLGHNLGAGHVPYPPAAGSFDSSAVLTVRDRPDGPRTVIPRDRWTFTGLSENSAPGLTHVKLSDSLEVGRIYELVYRATDPVVVGAGLAAVRDVASWLKHGTADAPRDSTHLAPSVQHVVAYGVSQTGRFLRHYVYENFNTDEAGRQALDGIFAHTAGAGRGSFNHRFAQPSRDAQPFSTFFYPTDVFPFTSLVTTDPMTRASGGLLARADTAHLPKVFYVDGGYEYWGRGASLTHTTPDGLRDVGFSAKERRYVVAGAQHSGPAGWPLSQAMAPADTALVPIWRGNPLDQRLALRALFVALVYWVRDDIPPPASVYPTLARRELVPSRVARVPRIPGLAKPAAPTPVNRIDLGPQWSRGIATEPPKVGAPYATLVSQVDSLGNEIGGIRSVELLVPLASYFPWQLRTAPPRDRMVSFRGTFVPLPPTEAERARRGDPRPSVELLYPSREEFLVRVDSAAANLVLRRFMLPEDVSAARRRMESVWEFVVGKP